MNSDEIRALSFATMDDGEELARAEIYGLLARLWFSPPDDELMQQFKVAVTQALLPLLRKARGRIVFVGSYSGRFTFPFLGGYAASKHALEAVADAFRLELRPSGIKVSLLEPGAIKTEIWRKADGHHEALLREVPAIEALYGDSLAAMLDTPKLGKATGIAPARVGKLIAGVLQARFPRARYAVGLDAKAMIPFFWLLPTFLADAVIALGLRVLARSR